jgi:hypothetical protein
MAKEAVAQAEQEKPDNNWLSFKSGILSFNDMPAKDNRMLCVIFDSAYENAWYPGAYDPKNIVAPDCWAIARAEEDMAPSNVVPEPVSPGCVDCPKNEWGSDPAGGKGKACKNVRRIALIQAADIAKGVSADVMLARIPTMSVRNWSKYVTQVANVVRRPTWGVVTELRLVPDVKSQFQVQFSFVENIPEEMLEHIVAIRAAAGNAILAEYTPNSQVESGSTVPVKDTTKKEKF